MKKLSKIEEEVISWNSKFPVDSWWRKKHNVAFMSQAHREVSFLDQLFEYIESQLFSKYEKESQDKYIPNTGDFLKRPEVELNSVESLREQFEREFLNGQDS